MKKIITTLALLAASTVYAGSVTVTGAGAQGVDGSSDQTQFGISVKENITKQLAGDIGMLNVQNDPSNTLSTRLEAGLTGTVSVYGIMPYVRLGVGEKFTNTTNFSYYSVEPGASVPLGNTGLSARLGYRYREAFDSSNNDTTRTWRAAFSYSLNKSNSINLGYDRQRGDSNQDITRLGFTHNF